MPSSWTDARRPLLLAAAAALGTGAALAAPGAQTTGAVLSDSAHLTTELRVSSCTSRLVAHLTTLAPELWWSFGDDQAPVGNLTAPGLPVCDSTTGALELGGGTEEGYTDPSSTLTPPTAAYTLAIWVHLAEGSTGDLATLLGTDGHSIRLVADDGTVRLLAVPVSGGPAEPVAQAAVGHQDVHLLTVTVVAAPGDGPRATFFVDGVEVGSGSVDEPAAAVRLTVGAPAGSGRPAARAVLDEVAVWDRALTPVEVGDLAAADGAVWPS